MKKIFKKAWFKLRDIVTALVIVALLVLFAVDLVSERNSLEAATRLHDKQTTDFISRENANLEKILANQEKLLKEGLKGVQQLLDRPVQVESVVFTREGRVIVRTVFVTRTKTVVICRTPSGKPCGGK